MKCDTNILLVKDDELSYLEGIIRQHTESTNSNSEICIQLLNRIENARIERINASQENPPLVGPFHKIK